MVTRRHALRLMGAGAAYAAAAAGCGSGGNKGDDRSGGGFAKEQTERGLNAARYAETGGFHLNHLPWAIDNRGVALLGARAINAAAARLTPPAPPLELVFIAPDGRPSGVSAASRFFALSRIGTAVYTENDGSAVYLTRPDSPRQLSLERSDLADAAGFERCEISDRAENVAVVVVAKPTSDATSDATYLLRGDSSGNITRVADAVGSAAPVSPGNAASEIIRRFGSIAINDAGEVAFDAERADGSRALYFVPVGGGGGTPVVIAADSSGGADNALVTTGFLRVAQVATAPSLNNDGMVAFAALRTDNRYAVLKWRGGVLTTVAVGEPGETYGQVSLNNAGGIAYTASVGRGNAGPPLSRVAYLPSAATSVEDGITFIASGDRFFGRRVVTPFLSGTRGLNDSLEMAISYGRTAPDGSVENYEGRAVLSVFVQTL